MDGLDRARRLHRDLFGRSAEVAVRAPGRVNLIGEHTDYNDGFVLPLALPVATYVVASRRLDDEVDVTSEAYGRTRLATGIDPTGWARYPAAVRGVLTDDGVDWVGFDAAITTDIPDGASLSSSAALEVALLLVQAAFRGDRPTPDQIARWAQRAEHLAVGLPSGIMDQLICARARAGAAQLIDCRSLAGSDHALPDGLRVLALDTMTRRELAESAYADRRAACERVAAAAGVPALRDLNRESLAAVADLDPTDRRRAAHVIDENQRTLDAAAALDRGDRDELGRLMAASHRSLRDDYEVSGPALDAMVEASEAAAGCVGARMTGGGFAGCTVAVVEADAVEAFSAEVSERFVAGGGAMPRVIDGTPSRGAEITDAT